MTPPYISINEPGEGGILRQGPLEVRGESEPGRSRSSSTASRSRSAPTAASRPSISPSPAPTS